MAKQSIGIGSSANDGTGDPLRTAFDKINDNFTELYGTTAEANDLIEDASPQLGGDLDVNGRRITSARSNEDIILLPNGTGDVVISALRVNGTTLDSSDSTAININDALVVDGTLNVSGASTLTGVATFTATPVFSADATFSDDASFLSDGAVVNFGANSEIQLTHVHDEGLLLTETGGGAPTLTFRDSALSISSSADGQLDIAADTEVQIATTLVDLNGNLDVSGTALVTGVATFTATPIFSSDVTVTDDVNLISDSAVITFGADSDTSLTHTDGTGLTLNSTNKLCFNDVSQFVQGISATVLGLGATDEIDLTATAIDVNGTMDVSGTLTTAAITATGAVSITGATSIAGLLTATSLTANDITSNGSNADLDINPQGTGAILLTGPITATGVQTTTGQLNVDNLRADGNTLSATNTNGSINITPAGTGSVVLGGEVVGVTNELNATDIEVSGVLRSNTIQSDTTDADISISSQGTGAVAISSQLTLTGSFLPAIHTFVATDAITVTEHAGRTLLLGEVGGNAACTLTLPAATGSGAVYKFIVSVTNTSNYKIQVVGDDTIDGIMMYLDEDGTNVSAFPTVAASDTITLNGGTTGGIVGDYLELIDIAADQYHVRGVMRVAAGANPATPFTAAVS
jgi:UDP-N-acetylglucosamine transferase subunit ALG13